MVNGNTLTHTALAQIKAKQVVLVAIQLCQTPVTVAHVTDDMQTGAGQCADSQTPGSTHCSKLTLIH